MTEELKPCPRCNGAAGIQTYTTLNLEHEYYAQCVRCNTATRRFPLPELAAMNWNSSDFRQGLDGTQPICRYCKWRSDEYTSVCVNDESDRLADFVAADDGCEHWEAQSGEGT